MATLTKQQAEMVYEALRVARNAGVTLAEQVTRDIERLEADAERFRQKAFDGCRSKRTLNGWMYERQANRLATNAVVMRELREMFASWKSTR